MADTQMTTVFIVLVACVLVWLLTRKRGTGKKSIYFFGDSITLGYGVADDEGFVGVFAAKIGASRVYRIPTPNPANGDISDATLDWPQVGESSTVVTRDGGGGRPVVAVNGAGLLRDYWATVRPNGPHDVLVIQCGINDAIKNAFKSETPEQFRANLTQLVSLAKVDAKRVYLLAPTYVSNAVRADVFPYLQAMREVGQVTGVQVIEPPTDESWYGADIYHPNAAGHAAIGQSVYEALR